VHLQLLCREDLAQIAVRSLRANVDEIVCKSKTYQTLMPLVIHNQPILPLKLEDSKSIFVLSTCGLRTVKIFKNSNDGGVFEDS